APGPRRVRPDPRRPRRPGRAPPHDAGTAAGTARRPPGSRPGPARDAAALGVQGPPGRGRPRPLPRHASVQVGRIVRPPPPGQRPKAVEPTGEGPKAEGRPINRGGWEVTNNVRR